MTTASQPMDKRMLRTREAIRCALLSLLNQKDASQINVSELTEKAQISRKTFYLHYASVDEALQELENEIEGWVMAQLAQSDIWDNRHDLYTILSRVDKALQEHETYSCYLENRRSRYFLMYRLKNSIAKMVKDEIRENAGAEAAEDDVEAAADFAVSGILSMYYDWLTAQRVTLRQLAEKAQKLLLGAVGGPKWEGLPGEQRPEKGLLRLRAGMGLYSNNRPAKIWPQLAPASPLKPEIVAQGIDFIIVRELIGGVYFGNHETHTLENGEKQAVDTMPYAEHEIERIGRIGFETARKRRKKLCCVDKANVLDTSRLWRSVMHRLQAEYPDVEYSEMFVDNCAMQIVKNPAQFDVIVTENMFGDILSDEASMITGSIGMIPSSSLGDGTRGLYEPIHGSAPDIAGRDIVNPTACILSAAMMLRYSFGMTEEADAIENAVNKVLDKGLRTADNMSEGCTCLGCTAMGDAILAEI